jgi:AsmA protein
METSKKKGRLSTIGLLLLGWLAIGLAAPIVFTLRSGEVDISPPQVNAAQRNTLALIAPLSIAGSPSIALERGTLQHVGEAGRAISGEAAEAKLAAGKARLSLDGGQLRIRFDGVNSGAPVPTGASIASPIEKAIITSNFETLILKRVTVAAILPDGRMEAVSDVSGELALRRKGHIAFKLAGQLRGQPVEISGSIAHFAGDKPASSTAPQPLRLNLKSEVLNATIDGALARTASHRFTGQVEAVSPRLRSLARWFGADWPSGPGLNNLNLKGKLEWSAAGLNFVDNKFAIDTNEATGSLMLQTRAERAAFSGTLALKTLDLTTYLSAPPDNVSRLSAWWRWLTTGDFSQSLLRALDADVRISAETVRIGGIDLGRTAAAVSLKNARLLANIVDLRIEESAASGELGLDYSGGVPKVTVRGKIDRGDMARLSKAALGASVLSGAAEIYADITASGRSTTEMSAAANGKITIDLREGGEVMADLKSLLSAAQQKDVLGWKAVRGATALDDLKLKLTLRQGLAVLEPVRAGTGDAQVSAQGSFDPVSGRLDARVQLGGSTSTGGKPDALLVGGTASEPTFRSEATTKINQPTPERPSNRNRS